MVEASVEGTRLVFKGVVRNGGLALGLDAAGLITAWDYGLPAQIVTQHPVDGITLLECWEVRGGFVAASLTMGDAALSVGGTAGGDRLSVTSLGTGGVTFWGRGGHDSLAGGSGDDVLTGDDGNDSLDGGAGDDRLTGGVGDDLLIGGAGIDTVIYAGDVAVTVDLRLTAQDTGLGRDTLSGFENITGGRAGDSLTGDDGRNVIDGGNGVDTMAGGAGDDDYILSGPGDIVVELDGEGFDSVFTRFGYTLPAGVEALMLTGTNDAAGTGNALNNLLMGNDGANRLEGGEGDDTLDGGAGRDVLVGGAGDDVYVIDLNDVVLESEGGGYDLAYSAGSAALMAGVEELHLTGSADASAMGNSLDNVIEGNSGANTLSGGGGIDTLIGGAGDDLFETTDPASTVIETADGGSDTLLAWHDAVLPQHVEVLRLGGAGALAGRGNESANLIEGGEGDNILSGGGGADTLAGGYGSDTYLLTAGDEDVVIIETAPGGVDVIQCPFSLVLPPGVEELVLSGAGNLVGTGNALDNRITGNGGNNTLRGGAGSDTLSGGAGADVYFADENDLVTEAPDGATDIVYASGSLDLGSGIEVLVLTGTGNSTGRGNTLANRIFGNAGANLLDGRGGADTLIGGAGDDVYMTDGGDLIAEAATGGGEDVVFATCSYTLPPGVEGLFLQVGGDFRGIGNSAANLIVGNAGRNLLIGGAGADTLLGGAGDDIYVVDAADSLSEAPGGGFDIVRASISYSLPPQIEALVLGGVAAISGTGNELANRIYGNAAANRLTGGLGADTLLGGAGNDTYVSDGRDLVVELAGGGIDRVLTTGSMALPAQVEHLSAASNVGLRLIGNSLANRIIGAAGADILIGLGGADTLAGGAGNDIYRIDAGDVVIEAAGQGIDGIITDGSAILPAGVEWLYLTGSRSVAGRGNTLANRISGNGGANLLDGRGGADTLIGGAGNDVYQLDGRDTVVELAGGGHDTARSSASWVMANGVEDLVLTGTAGLSGIGNALANRIYGNAAANALAGGAGADTLVGGGGADRLTGGLGRDLLVGGTGADRFVFTAGSGVDFVRGFENGLDRFEIAAGAHSYADLTIRQQGAHAWIVIGPGAGFLLLDTAARLLDPSDFVFT